MDHSISGFKERLVPLSQETHFLIGRLADSLAAMLLKIVLYDQRRENIMF